MIRAANPSDAQRICAMTAAVSAHEGLPPPRFDSQTFLHFGFGPERAFECYVAEASEGVVGHILITMGFDVQEGGKTIWVADLFVTPEHRRSGFGRALMAHVCKRAISSDVCYIHFMMAPENDTAACFYDFIGAAQDRGKPMFLSRDIIGPLSEQST